MLVVTWAAPLTHLPLSVSCHVSSPCLSQVTIGTFLFHVLSVVLHGMVVFRMLYSLDLWLNMAW